MPAALLPALLPALMPIVGDVVKSVFPDKQEQARVQQAITQQFLQRQSEIEQAAAGVIQQEAASRHWLAANWRPITMLTFLGLIVARWFGFAAPDLSEAECLKLWSIVEIGLGGYVVGRSVEKIIPPIMQNTKGK